MKDDKRLKRKVRNSYIVSTVSITLVLFLLGSVGYLMVAALKVADTLQESIAVTVELKNGLSEAQKETISKRLTAEEMVATIAYSAKEEKAEEEEFRKMFGSSFEEILPENPLLDSFELTLTSACGLPLASLSPIFIRKIAPCSLAARYSLSFGVLSGYFSSNSYVETKVISRGSVFFM